MTVSSSRQGWTAMLLVPSHFFHEVELFWAFYSIKHVPLSHTDPLIPEILVTLNTSPQN